MKTIDDIWALLAPEGEFKRRRKVCERLWDSYEPAMQEAIYARIDGKLARYEFVNKNPYFAIEDNGRELQEMEPEFKKGNEGGDLVQVLYKGMYKICTRATMELFGLQWIKDWN